MGYLYVKRARAKKRAQLQEIKDGQVCARCQDAYPHYCLDWHHRDPTTKTFGIANAPRDNLAWEKILAEIKKCVLLCKNCHAIVEWEKLSCATQPVDEACLISK